MVAKARKLKEGGKLEFGQPMPETELAEPPSPKAQHPVSVASGQVAGIGRDCEAITVALALIKERCDKARATKILTPEEDVKLYDIAEECAAVKTTIEEIWRDAQRMCDAGIGVEKKEESAW